MAAADTAPAPQDAAPAEPGAGWYNTPLDEVRPAGEPPQGALAPKRREALEGVSPATAKKIEEHQETPAGAGWFNKGLDEIEPHEQPPPPPEPPPPLSFRQRVANAVARNTPDTMASDEAESEVGAGEAAANIASGMTVAPIGQGLNIMSSLAAGRGVDESLRRGQQTAEALTYQPRTEQGQAAAEVASVPMQKVEDFADTVGQRLMEEGYTDPETGLKGEVPPALAAAVKTAILQGAMMLPIPGLRGMHEAPPADPLVGVAHKVIEQPHTVMEEAQATAAAHAAAAGGDALAQVGAAVQVNAELGAHHDAAAVHATRMEQRRQAAQQEMEAQQAQEAELQKDQDFGAAERQAGKAPGEAPTADEAFAQREQEGALAQRRLEAQKDRDFVAARNQAGDQAVAQAEGAERGGAAEPKPTLGEAIPPEQASALAELRQRLQNAPPREESVVERMKAAHPEDDFQQLGPETPAKEPAKQEPMAPRTVAERIAAQRKAKAPPAPEAVVEAPKAPETAAEASLPEGNPPAPTAKSLAERRQAALDEKLAAKISPAAKDLINEQRAARGQPLLLREGKSDLRQNYDPAEQLLEEQVRRDMEAAGRNPGGKRPPLVQGRDLAEPLYEQKVRQDVDASRLAKPENDWFTSLANQFGMKHEDAVSHLKPIIDRLPPELQNKITIHPSVEAARGHPAVRAQDRELLKDHPRARGMFDPTADRVHVFAASHDLGDTGELEKTLVHEAAHMGMRKLLGADYGRTMLDIAKNGDTKLQAWMNDYARKAKMDMGIPNHRAVIADEYAAHLAEKPAENPTAWRQIKDAVRAGLRKLGIVREWNDNDIQRLLRNGAKKLGTDSMVNDLQGRSLLSGGDRDEPADSPLSRSLAMTKEDQTKYTPSWNQKIADTMRDFGFRRIPDMLSVVDMRHLPDFVNKEEMPSAKLFIQANDARRGRAGRLQQPAYEQLRAWSKDAGKDPTSNATLGTVMHASTIAGVDPSKPFEPRFSKAETAADPAKASANAAAEQMHARLKKMFDDLPEKWQQRYSDVRDDYTAHRDAVWKGLQARINETEASADTKKSAMTTLRRMFESSKVAGPYFPLFRTGDYWGRAMDADGNHVAFTRFESTGERKQWLKNMQDLGFQTEAGKKDTTNKSLMERIDPDFVRQIMDVTKDSPELQDEIWQTYLKALPEMSMRKQFIHRQGRLGFSADAMRAYAHNMFHGSQQIARLEYGNRMDTHVRDLQDQADALQKSAPGTMKAEMASAVASEFVKRNDWIKNPQNSPWTNVVNQLGFTWYLGFAPATAFRIHTQNSMLASPILAAKFGQLGATRELNRAALKWATTRGNLGDTLRGDERRAFDEAADQGMFTNTWASTLGSAANGMPPDEAFGLKGQAGRAGSAVLRASQWLFNAVEHKNRQTTFLAAYRLGRAKGMGHDEAFQTANSMTWDAHLDYGNDNRARFLQGNVMKVAGQFRQYPMGVAYRLARDFRNSLGNENLSPQEVAESRKQFAGILLRSFMYAGATGLPAMWAITAGINMAMGDKDHPFDAQQALHSYLQKEMGRTGADAVMYGPVSAATGASISSGASYSDLIPFGGWYKPPLKWNEMTPQERMSDAMQQVAGPAYGALVNMGAGATMERNPELALEHFVPPALQGPIKAYQYATQGATNLRGQQIMKPEEFNMADLIEQTAGFTPQKLTDRRAAAGTMGEMNRLIQARHSQLMQALDDAVESKDSARIKKAQDDINAFNKAQPGAAVKNEARGVQANEKANALSYHGTRLSKGLKDKLVEQYGGGEK